VYDYTVYLKNQAEAARGRGGAGPPGSRGIRAAPVFARFFADYKAAGGLQPAQDLCNQVDRNKQI